MPQQPVETILLRQWASYMTMPIWIAGPDENLVYYNEPAEELLGRRFDDASEMALKELPALFELANEDGSPLSMDAFPLAIALRERRPAHSSVRYKSLDDIWRTVQITAFPIEGVGNRHLGAVAIFWESEDS